MDKQQASETETRSDALRTTELPTHDAWKQQVDALIRGPQYALPQAEKDALLTAILRELCRDVAARCPPYAPLPRPASAADRGSWRSLADIPPLPVAMFKRFLLSAVPPEKIVRELHSSATTGQQPSRIVDRQDDRVPASPALVSILKEHIGGRAAAAVGARRGRVGGRGRAA